MTPHQFVSRLAPGPRRMPTFSALAACAALLCLGTAAQAADTNPAGQLQRWTAEAAVPASAERGKAFFSKRFGGEWSCASCHNAPPTTEGKHPNTGKVIPPLAPSFNPKAFTEEAKVDKWIRRNCKDVLSRECSAGEKADVLAYLITLK